MKSKYIDISVSLDPKMPIWPGGYGLRISKLLDQRKGDIATVSRLDMDVHNGTHIDAPQHFIEGGNGTSAIALDKLIGLCQVINLEGHRSITKSNLIVSTFDPDIKKILLKTDNSKLWSNPYHVFFKEYAALTKEAAEFLVEKEIHLVGIDYHSIQLFEDSPETHKVLLREQVVILEGLDLSTVEEGVYELYCLPLKINQVEGAPARAILKIL